MSEPKAVPAARSRKGYVDGPFGQIHYYEAGAADSVPLMLAHQSPVSGRMFERAMPYLAAAGIRAIAVDTPGYGNSDVPDSPPDIPEYALAFGAVLDGLGLERAHLLGHHTGAMSAANYAARFPNRIASLILNGPPLFSAEDFERFKNIKHQAPVIKADGSHLQAAWDRRVSFSHGWSDAVAMHRRLVDQLWAGDTVWYGHRAAFAFDMQPDFMALTVPTLILTNTGDDIYHLARKARELRPDFAYAELEGGSHDIVDEQPEAWSEKVAAFVLS